MNGRMIVDFDDIYDPLLFTAKALGYTFLAAAATLIARDVAWYCFNLPTKNQTLITKHCYSWFSHYLPKPQTAAEKENFKNIDFSEGIFDFSNPLMTLQQATLNKYEYIYKTLGLQPGMTLLDAGCGTGVWMDFCRAKGVNAIGLTLCPEQAAEIKGKGLKAEVRDYRVANPEFYGNFDRVSVIGSSEHVCSSMGTLANGAARDRSVQTYGDMFNVLQSYLKPDGKIFVSVLTMNDEAEWSLMDYAQVYVLDSHYGGFYPRMNDIIEKIVPAANLKMSFIEDHTASYHWSSMVEPKHFGYFKIDWSKDTWDKLSYILISFAKSPLQFPFHWLYQAMDTWMWQMGGAQDKPLSTEQVAKVPTQLKYFLLEPTGLRANSMFSKDRLLVDGNQKKLDPVAPSTGMQVRF